MKIKNLKVGIVMALTLAFMGAPMVKASATQATSDSTTLNINEDESITGTENEDLTEDECLEDIWNKGLENFSFWDGDYTEDEYLTEDEEDEDFAEYDYFAIDRDFNVNQSDFGITYDETEYIDFLKDEFKKQYGEEDEFQTIYEDEYVKEEVNGKTTEFKTTNKETEEVDSYNYFASLDERLRVSQMNEEESKKYVQEQINQAKENFQKQYGKENKFIKISEDENTIEEVNGYTGEYRTTDKRTRSVADVYNYFDDLNEELKNVSK